MEQSFLHFKYRKKNYEKFMTLVIWVIYFKRTSWVYLFKINSQLIFPPADFKFGLPLFRNLCTIEKTFYFNNFNSQNCLYLLFSS